jgi:hypothetical protein
VEATAELSIVPCVVDPNNEEVVVGTARALKRGNVPLERVDDDVVRPAAGTIINSRDLTSAAETELSNDIIETKTHEV